MTVADSKTPNNIVFEELEGSPTIDIDDNGVSAMRVFKVAWGDVDDFVQELLGVYDLQDADGNSIATWQTGATVVYSPTALAFPGYPNSFVRKVSVRPIQPETPDGKQVTLGTQANTYTSADFPGLATINGAVITAYYETQFDADSVDRDWGKAADTSVSISPPDGTYFTYGDESEASGEILQVPGRTFLWLDTQEKLANDLNPGIVIPRQTHVVNWHRTVAPPWTTMQQMIGKVNQGTFLGAPAGTVLYLGYKPYRTPRYQKKAMLWRIAHRFEQQSKYLSDGTIVGWNYLYKPTTVDGNEHWIKIVTADTNEPPHKTGDFSALFRYGA